MGVQPRGRLSAGTIPGDGRKPTMPQKDAGMRNDPPVSEPVQIGSMSAARAAADPPDEPPQVRIGSKGLPVAPQTGLRVFAPEPNSGVLVLPTMIAPAALSRATITLSSAGTKSLNNGDPNVVRT